MASYPTIKTYRLTISTILWLFPTNSSSAGPHARQLTFCAKTAIWACCTMCSRRELAAALKFTESKSLHQIYLMSQWLIPSIIAISACENSRIDTPSRCLLSKNYFASCLQKKKKENILKTHQLSTRSPGPQLSLHTNTQGALQTHIHTGLILHTPLRSCLPYELSHWFTFINDQQGCHNIIWQICSQWNKSVQSQSACTHTRPRHGPTPGKTQIY